jgi:hypothetical protein
MFVYSDKELNHQFFTNLPAGRLVTQGRIFRLVLRNDYFYVSGMFPSGQEGEFKGGMAFEFLFLSVFLFAPSIHPKIWFIHKYFLSRTIVNLIKILSKSPGKKAHGCINKCVPRNNLTGGRQ